MTFSAFVKNVREKLNMTQQELADALDVSFASVNRWENNQVFPSKLAIKSFREFCENNFIDVPELEK